jgi:hypothetical protein
MTHSARAALGLLIVGGIAAVAARVLVGCYTLPEPACGFECGSDGACPTEYSCAADNRCHLNGSPTDLVCVIPDAAIDAAPDAPIDAARDATPDAP